MTVASIKQARIPWLGQNGRFAANRWRLTLFFVILGLFAWDSEMRDITMHALSDAYFQVTVFVAGTLALVFWFEKVFAFDLGQMMRRNVRWQPLIASGLGALPGCGGAIIVVTQFTKGHATFGAFISVLVATMGDAAFLLMARDPQSFLIVMAVSLSAGTVTGWIVDYIHGRNYMAIGSIDESKLDERLAGHNDDPVPFSRFWITLAAFGLIPAAAIALNYDAGENAPFTFLGDLEIGSWLGFLCALFCIGLWSISKRPDNRGLGADTLPNDSLLTRVVKDTNFVTAWVVVAFLIYEIASVKFGLDVGSMFEGYLLLIPTIAILIGFIPGCGPQVVVSSLYIAGAVPMSAQLSNAIANDGDALFPALALAPKAAILATLYSAVPAFIIGYSWLFFFEM